MSASTQQTPFDGTPINVHVTATGQAAWDPESAVVFAGQTTCGPCDPPTTVAAESCCGYINFFAGPAAARAWAEAHPQVRGRLLDQYEALELGVSIFGPLLDQPAAEPPACPPCPWGVWLMTRTAALIWRPFIPPTSPFNCGTCWPIGIQALAVAGGVEPGTGRRSPWI
ncbi:organomercurial lyase [Nonomuraea rubra]|uniref:organomercurial lyase n=1 Tax=Nonomuraea rubra TaxID=46180 RepID=UPI0033D87E55